MKLLAAAICAGRSSPVEMTLNSLRFAFTPACSAYAFAVLIIWMRQVLPMKPLSRAMRYGPFFFLNWKNLVVFVQGLKHFASAPGPCTISGPPASAAADNPKTSERLPIAARSPHLRAIRLIACLPASVVALVTRLGSWLESNHQS